MIRLSNFPAYERLIIGLAFILVIAAPAGLAHGQGDGVFGNDNGGPLLATLNKNETSGSGNCAMVRSGLRDQVGQGQADQDQASNDQSGDNHWGSVREVISARDPLWQAMLNSEINQSPPFQTLIVDQRTHCHTLMARVQVLSNGLPVVLAGSGFLIPAHPLKGAAIDSVTCTWCHQL